MQMVFMSNAKVYTYPITTMDANYSHYYFKSIWYIIIESIYQQWYILDGLDWAWKHLKCARSQEFRRRDLTTSARILFDKSMHDRSS